jgi:hypothetical protein
MSVRTIGAAAIVAAIAFFSHGVAQPPKPAEGKAAQPAADKANRLTDLLAKRVSLDQPYEGKFKVCGRRNGV